MAILLVLRRTARRKQQDQPSSLALVSVAHVNPDATVERFRAVATAVVSRHLSLVPGAVSLIHEGP